MLASLAMLFVAVLLLLFLLQGQRGEKFPPGPRVIPIFGNVLQLNLKSPIKDLERLTKKYGKVYSIFFGSRPLVVVNGLEAFKETLVSKAFDFCGKPQDIMFNYAFQVQAHAPGVVLADYSPIWKEQRRFSLMTLRNFGLGKQSMEQRILAEISHVTKVLEENAGGTMDPHLLFHNAASCIICQVLFGKHFEYEDEFLKFSVELFHVTSKILNGPWGIEAFRLFRASRQKRLQFMAENKKTRVPGKPRHFIDCYLDEMDKRGDDGSSFCEDQLCALLLDLHYAGTDTIANTLLSAFLFLSYYPHIQDKVLDGKDEVSFEDRQQMPYVQAVIHEIHRKGDVTPLGLYHSATKDTELMGYSIPKGTIVVTNISSVLNEEGQWKFPHEFNPENFLNDQGEFVKPEAYLPFSAGVRMCLGEALARMEVFLVTVSLLRKFRFTWPEDAGEPDFTPLFGTIQTPKPYRMKIQLRETP
uniref:Uncharacterized protein n=1 Tax=Cynoglossus semilaevis TaxID=244447 RepID=A0A3P8X662_CYNSE